MVYDFPDLVVVIVGRSRRRLLLFPSLYVYIAIHLFPAVPLLSLAHTPSLAPGRIDLAGRRIEENFQS